MTYRKHIHLIDNDSLLQIFNFYRLEDEDDWHLRHTWRRLAHVCRRWRYLIYNSSYHLNMRLILTNKSSSIDTLGHLPPLPLVIDFSDRTKTLRRKDKDNIHLGLQCHGRVRQVAICAPSPSLRILLESMNNPFPRLEDLSLLSTTSEEMSLALPEVFQAPFLSRLSLHGIGFPKGLSSLSSMFALSILSLTHIQHSSYFTPGHLTIQLQGLLCLEELSIGFATPIPLPSSEGELLPTPIQPVTLPTLRRLTFRGVSVYLDNLVAQINTPVLERISLTLLFELTFTLVNLTEYISRTKGFGCLVARVIFNKATASIDAGYDEQWGTGKSSFHVDVDCKSLDWQIDSAMQICSAIRKVLSTVEELTLDLDVDGMPLDWENTLDSDMWHELLLPFVGAKKLHIGSSLTLELSRALELAAVVVPELLPELQKLEVKLEIDHAKKAFSRFIETRELTGSPVHLLAPPLPDHFPLHIDDQTSTSIIPFNRSEGFLVKMFGRRYAEFFIESLLKTDAREVNLVGNVPGCYNALMSQMPSIDDAGYAALTPNGQPLWLLDFIPQPIYHVVPQKIRTPPRRPDWRRYVEQATRRMPVFFIQNNGAVGLPLAQALNGDKGLMRGADKPAPLGGGLFTQIRIVVSSASLPSYLLLQLTPTPPPPPFVRLNFWPKTSSHHSGPGTNCGNARYRSGTRLGNATRSRWNGS